MNRKIKPFNDDNWWEWGRKYFEKDGERIYVNGKTRNTKPFYISDVKAYDGSVLALFPKNGIDLSHAVDCLNKANWGGVWFYLQWTILIYSEESSKRTNCILMIPKVLLEVRDYLRDQRIVLSTGSASKRSDSSDSERIVVSHIQNAQTHNRQRWNTLSPNIGSSSGTNWYDIMIEDCYVDIKISECNSSDNTNAKQAVYWFITGEIKSFCSQRRYLFSRMRANENPNESRDFYYLIVNKNNTSDVFIVSLKGISTLVPNGNNRPFQAQWHKCREPVSRTWSEAKNFLLGKWAESIHKEIESNNHMLRHYPEYFENLIQ